MVPIRSEIKIVSLEGAFRSRIHSKLKCFRFGYPYLWLNYFYFVNTFNEFMKKCVKKRNKKYFLNLHFFHEY